MAVVLPLEDVYRKIRGSSIKISLQFSLVGSLAGFVVLMLVNGLKFEFTPFTLIITILASINGFAFTFLEKEQAIQKRRFIYNKCFYRFNAAVCNTDLKE